MLTFDNVKKVAVVTFNPALDWVGELPKLQLNDVNRVDKTKIMAAGKGINVSRVLSQLGVSVTVTGFLGTQNATMFDQLFKMKGWNDQFVRVEGSNRINLKLLSSEQGVTELNFSGMTISLKDQTLFTQRLECLMQEHDVFVVSGSLPTGLPIELAQSWLLKLTQAGKIVFFDASEAWFAKGIIAQPYCIKPNQSELAKWGLDCQFKGDQIQAIQRLHQQGIQNVILSLGEKGAIWLDQLNLLTVSPPCLPIVSTVGAGDSLVAGLCFGYLQNWSKAQTLHFSVALSALSVSHMGVGEDSLSSVLSLMSTMSAPELITM